MVIIGGGVHFLMSEVPVCEKGVTKGLMIAHAVRDLQVPIRLSSLTFLESSNPRP